MDARDEERIEAADLDGGLLTPLSPHPALRRPRGLHIHRVELGAADHPHARGIPRPPGHLLQGLSGDLKNGGAEEARDTAIAYRAVEHAAEGIRQWLAP